MSTKTMHLPPRRNKRKEREDFDALNQPPKPNRPQAGRAEPPVPVKAEPGKPNLVMAGYLAHEFLTLGTLFGKPWDSARAEPRTTQQQQQQQQQSTNPKPKPMDRAGAVEAGRIYADVAGLLGTGGAHLPGIVNPTQLARFLHK